MADTEHGSENAPMSPLMVAPIIVVCWLSAFGGIAGGFYTLYRLVTAIGNS
jgi:hypothetical protein